MLRQISAESIVLSFICVADLLSTIFLVSYRGFEEGNPIMGYYLQTGVGWFVVAKCILFVLPLFIAEWARRKNPRFVKQTLRACIGVYLVAYGMTFYQTNGSSLSAIRQEAARHPITASMFVGGR